MRVLVPKPANSDGLSLFPLIYWGNASSLFFPVPVDEESASAVWLLACSNCFLVWRVVFALWIERVIDPSHAVGVSAVNQAIHSLFVITSHQSLRRRLVLHGDWVSRPIFDCIAFKAEDILR